MKVKLYRYAWVFPDIRTDSYIAEKVEDNRGVKFVFYKYPESKKTTVLKENELEIIKEAPGFFMYSTRRCKMLYRRKLIWIFQKQVRKQQSKLDVTKKMISILKNPYSYKKEDVT